MIASVLGLDVGGTKIASGLVGADGMIVASDVVPTAGSGHAVVAQVAAIIARYRDFAAVGLVVPGAVDPVSGVVRRATNLGWHDLDLARRLALPVPVHLENDASAAAWAEHRFGTPPTTDPFDTGRPNTSVVLVTVGTGLGGGIVVNGDIVRGHTGAGGEIGHLPMEPGGRPCECGARGCWEQYASGRALDRAAIAAGRPDGRAALAAAALGDGPARDLVAGVARHLVRGITVLTATLDPACVLLGGGLGTDPRFLPFVQDAAAAIEITPPRSRVPIRAASLGPLAGVIGAADLARVAAPHHR